MNSRNNDQPYSSFLLIYGLLVFTKARASTEKSGVPEMKLAGIAGLGILFSPTIGPPLLLALAGLLWTRRQHYNRRKIIAICTIIVLASVVPWGVRNDILLGKFIPTRSTLNLEIATGNQSGAVGYITATTDLTFHPVVSVQAAQKLAEIGEVEYMRSMGDRANAWIVNNPASFATLTLRRIWLTFIPDETMAWPDPAFRGPLRWLCYAIFGAAKLAACITVILLCYRPLLWFAFCILPLAPYFFTHLNTRYLFIVLFPTACLISHAVSRVRIDIIQVRACQNSASAATQREKTWI